MFHQIDDSYESFGILLWNIFFYLNVIFFMIIVIDQNQRESFFVDFHSRIFICALWNLLYLSIWLAKGPSINYVVPVGGEGGG